MVGEGELVWAVDGVAGERFEQHGGCLRRESTAGGGQTPVSAGGASCKLPAVTHLDYAGPGAAGERRPGVIAWFWVYCGLMVALYVMVLGAGVFFLAAPRMFMGPIGGPEDELAMRITGGVYAAMGLLLAAAFVVPFFAGRRKWRWIYGIVLIALGMTSCCFLPLLIPLLIFWVKPEVRAWHGYDAG